MWPSQKNEQSTRDFASMKIDSPTPRSYQLPIAPQPEVRVHADFPTPCWNFIWIKLWFLRILSQLLWIYMEKCPARPEMGSCLSSFLLLLVCFVVIHFPWAFKSFLPLFGNDSWALREANIDFSFRDENPTDSHSLYLSIALFCKRKFSDNGWPTQWVHMCITRSRKGMV